MAPPVPPTAMRVASNIIDDMVPNRMSTMSSVAFRGEYDRAEPGNEPYSIVENQQNYFRGANNPPTLEHFNFMN